MELFWTIVFGLLFFALLMASVALHEIGHLLPAKLFGVRVPQYFVGFGRTLWSTRRGETEYGIKLFPLGGFVRLLGMYPPARPGARQTWLQRFADDARSYEWDDITPTDVSAGRLFFQKRTHQKLIIMAGGITMNLLLAFLLFWGVSALHGNWREQPVVRGIQQCIIAEQRDDTTCRPTDEPTPAAAAGLVAGDRIVSFNGTPIVDYPQLTGLIRANLDRPATLVVERDGARVTLPTVPTRIAGVRDTLDPAKVVPAGWLGVLPTVEKVHGGPVSVLKDMGTMTVQSVVALVQFPVKVWHVVVGMVTGQPRDVYGPISIVGASALAGEAAVQEAPIADRAALFASLLGSINLFLALFNLVPLPPLDGGHIMGALWEWVRRTAARLTGRPDPGPVDTAKMVPVAYAVGGFLLLCGIVLIVADIVSPVKIF
ncbi:MAG: M50 family metallopeptidase [Propionibacteriaceae bacterium]|nr:M50 family metallopeptidase [Propionibacteriaceae bacterium]